MFLPALILSSFTAGASCNRTLWNEQPDPRTAYDKYESAFGRSARKAEFMVELVKVFDRYGEPGTRRVTRAQIFLSLTAGGRFTEKQIVNHLNRTCHEGWVILERGGPNGRWVIPEEDLIARIDYMDSHP